LEPQNSNEARRCDICGERPGAVDVIYTGGAGQRGGSLCQQCARDAVSAAQGGPFDVSQIGRRGAGGGPAISERRRAAQRSGSDTPALDEFGRDLTAEARSGRIDPLIGRDEEIEQTIEILARRRKNNAVLIGEPGVGKTAIAEGLAARISSGDVPEPLRGRRLVSLDLGGMLAGAQFRGQFEQRLKSVLEEVSSSEGRILLFLDELHTVLGAGAAEGAMDAANLLKPMLARGELRMVGATTLDEYRRIERDGALARRFSPVMVEEPSVEETVAILQGLRSTYEEHHGCMIDDEALEAAARLSDRYLNDQQLPDKAIDLIDQAGARMRLRGLGVSEPSELDGARAALDQARAEKADAVRIEDYERAGWLKGRIDELEGRVAELSGEAESDMDGDGSESGPAVVGEAEIASIIAARTGIPVGQLVESELARLASLEDDLHSRVVGQEEAVELVSDTVRRAFAGLSEPDQPLGSFLFLGPTGVGKTELVKALSERLFASEKALVRIDMSEYREPHTVARLIGSPPGYVGYGDGGQLTEPVRRRPYSVILLDEIEKAHPEVWNVLLQVLDDGRLTDGEGRTVDFSNAVIVMTSNLGAGKAKRGVGFTASSDSSAGSDDSARMMEAVKRAFLPEFLNRIDETVAFKSLTEAQVEEICAMVVDRVADRMSAEHGVSLEASDALISRLATDGFDAEFGARPLKRHVRRTLEKELTRAVLTSDGALVEGAVVRADVDDDGRVVLDVRAPAAIAAA
jgi:ATP-dependent Clp protease ATP-binding subunit ClpC